LNPLALKASAILLPPGTILAAGTVFSGVFFFFGGSCKLPCPAVVVVDDDFVADFNI
jgi:hypothetical protein